MANLIDRDFALKTYQDVCYGISCYDCKARDEFGACLFEQWIRGLPSAEPEVIRCRDCKHWTNNIMDSELRENYCNEKVHGFFYQCNGDDYCSRAERKTDSKKPSEKQISYAEYLAVRMCQKLPEEFTKEAYSEFIDKWKPAVKHEDDAMNEPDAWQMQYM